MSVTKSHTLKHWFANTTTMSVTKSHTLKHWYANTTTMSLTKKVIMVNTQLVYLLVKTLFA